MNLAVEICGLKLRNPVIPAAGPMVRNGDALAVAAKEGAGALVTKTISVTQAVVPRPCIAKVKEGLLNAEYGSDLAPEKWLNVELVKAKRTGLPLIASVGYKPAEISELAPKLEAAGVDALELSTHYLADTSSLIEVTKTAKEKVDIPVFVKLSPNTLDIIGSARAAEGAGADGLVAINTLGPCMAIDIETARPILGSSGGYGWLSGPAIKPLALRCVADICRAVHIPVIGVGGISDGRDAVEFIMAGATAVQVCTAAIVRGPKIYALIADEIARFMRVKGYNSIEDFKGIALRHLPEQPLRTRAKPPELIQSKCTSCGLCEKYCIYGAIRIIGKIPKIDPGRCYGCGLCATVCPTRALLF
ncbi:MAG: 4Fe-4S binding protein [Candidatus Hodarchaeaceae archaeon]|nr:4Fe-4S binding protein [Candidatus Hodarchaeaceae archaeon]